MKCEGKNKSGTKRMKVKQKRIKRNESTMGGSKGTKVQWEDQKERKKEQWEDQKERKYNGRTKRMKRTVGRSKE